MMRSNLKISESVPNKIPEIILAYDYNPNMSSIESPLSSARKRFNAYVINEHVKNKKASLSPEQVSALWEKRFLKRSKTIPQIGKYEEFPKDLLLKFPKDSPPSYIETLIRSEREPAKNSEQKNRKRSSLLTKGDSLSTLTQEDFPPDLCDELFDFFERQNKLNGKPKVYNLTGSKKFTARNSNAISYYVEERPSRSDQRGSSGIPKKLKSFRKETNTHFDSEKERLELSLELGYKVLEQKNAEKEKKKRKKMRKLRDERHAAIEYDRIRKSKRRSATKKSSHHSRKKKAVSYLSSPYKDEAVSSMYSAKQKNFLHCLDGENSVIKKPFPEAA